MTDDKTLIGRLKHGDQNALESIYVKYRPKLMATAFSYHVDFHQAEDIVHDVFLSLSNRISDFEINHSLYSYLRAAIINGIRDVVRRRSRQDISVLQQEAISHEGGVGPSEISIYIEETQRIEALMDLLSNSQREVVCLRIRHGLKFKEIARVQGVSSSTVRGRYRYGISRLRDLTTV